MTTFETAIRPIYNLLYLVIALGLVNLIGFIIYRRNVKRHGRHEAKSKAGNGTAVIKKPKTTQTVSGCFSLAQNSHNRIIIFLGYCT